MVIRTCIALTAASVCFAAIPVPDHADQGSGSALPPLALEAPVSETPLTNADFTRLAQTDPLAMLSAAIRRYREEIHGYTARLDKQERVGGTLYAPEVIQLAVRDTPYAVRMTWEKGARSVLFAPVEGVLYADGENGGNIKVWRPTSFLKFVDSGPNDSTARGASRYSITEAGLASALERTYRAWSEADRVHDLQWKYVATRPVPECGGRVCHIIHRTCSRPELDPFRMSEPRPDATQRPDEAFTSITLMFDAETWLQIGSRLERADQQLVACYYFRDIVFNPEFPADTFTPASFQKK
ncbi:MAG: DUF1571 domain-containing protein [Bacteroidales bacterium]|nr:DUF1571 domain-containing protein [Bacteroidales bacterium]